MANALYDKGREAFLKAQINWIDDVIKVALVQTPSSSNNSGYKVDLTSHKFLSSVPADSIIDTKILERGSSDADNGVANGSNVTFENVPLGKVVGAIIIYKQSQTADAGASQLIAYLDQLNGLPYQANGSNIQINWDNGINKIFKL